MAKIMLVEDDTNLAEIYQARLVAEGYQIVSAADGEAALALAAKEKPDLIISDVMMPKISGFEMLDILRNTDGLKSSKVIMLTALGQAEDKTRAEGLGADRYLVKSQVTLEDIVKAVQELLGEAGATPGAPVASAPAAVPSPPPAPAPAAPLQSVDTTPPATPAVSVPATPQPPAPVIPVAVAPQPTAAPVASAPTTAQPTPAQPPTAPDPPVQPAAAAAPPTQPILPPLPSSPPAPPTATMDDKLVSDAVNDLLTETAAEAASKPASPSPTLTPAPTTAQPTPAQPPTAPDPPVQPAAAAPLTQSSAQEEAAIKKQIASFAGQPSSSDSTPAQPSSDQKTSSILTAEKEAAPAETTSDNVAIAHKKVISPISDSGAAKKPSLESLLAAEEGKNPGTLQAPIVAGDANGQSVAKPSPQAPHPPGHVVTPNTSPASSNTGTGIDPNSIAL